MYTGEEGRGVRMGTAMYILPTVVHARVVQAVHYTLFIFFPI
jgi:hypothetical protein